MYRTLVTALLVVCAVDAADARRRSRYYAPFAEVVVVPPASRTFSAEFGRDSGRSSGRRYRSLSSRDPVPESWTLQPPDPNWKGKRFVSPDGASWLATYTSPSDPNSINAHMQTVAFAEGETIT